MHYIRTAETMARVLERPLEPELHKILTESQEWLASNYGLRLEEQADNEILTACGWGLKPP